MTCCPSGWLKECQIPEAILKSSLRNTLSEESIIRLCSPWGDTLIKKCINFLYLKGNQSHPSAADTHANTLINKTKSQWKLWVLGSQNVRGLGFKRLCNRLVTQYGGQRGSPCESVHTGPGCSHGAGTNRPLPHRNVHSDATWHAECFPLVHWGPLQVLS